MLYGMKIANLAYVTKTRVRFFKLDRWADVSDINTHHKSLLAKIFHDRCVCVRGAGRGGSCLAEKVWVTSCWGKAPSFKEWGKGREGAHWSGEGWAAQHSCHLVSLPSLKLA